MAEEDAYITQDDSELNVIFIHSKLDDIGLTPQQFRLFAHLSRRAHSAGKAWPGIDSMSKVCRMHKETVIEALRFLEDSGMILIEKSPGKRSVYRMTAPSKWRPVGNGERSEMGNGAVGNGERHQSESGNVRKSIEGNPKKEGAKAPTKKEEPEDVPLPVELDTQEFRDAWDLWTSERRKKKIKPYTAKGLLGQFAILKVLGPARAIAAINHSIAQQYQGIYEAKQSQGAGNGQSRNAGTFNADRSSRFKGVERLAS